MTHTIQIIGRMDNNVYIAIHVDRSAIAGDSFGGENILDLPFEGRFVTITISLDSADATRLMGAVGVSCKHVNGSELIYGGVMSNTGTANQLIIGRHNDDVGAITFGVNILLVLSK